MCFNIFLILSSSNREVLLVPGNHFVGLLVFLGDFFSRYLNLLAQLRRQTAIQRIFPEEHS